MFPSTWKKKQKKNSECQLLPSAILRRSQALCEIGSFTHSRLCGSQISHILSGLHFDYVDIFNVNFQNTEYAKLGHVFTEHILPLLKKGRRCIVSWTFFKIEGSFDLTNRSRCCSFSEFYTVKSNFKSIQFLKFAPCKQVLKKQIKIEGSFDLTNTGKWCKLLTL